MENVLLRCRGLYTFPNSLSEIPEGALSDASNIIIDRDGTIAPRRGIKVYGSSLGAVVGTRAKALLVYKDRVIRHWLSNIDYDSDNQGTFQLLSNSVTEVQPGLRIKYVEANGNFYFTTLAGIKKLSVKHSSDLATAAVTNAGGIKALDGTAAVNLAPGYLPQDSQVAYRIVWGLQDANTNVILGVPSERIILVNPMQSLLVHDFNNLLNNIQTVANASSTDDLSDTNYASLAVATNVTAAGLQTALLSLVSKLDNDLIFSLTGSVTSGSTTVSGLSSTTKLRVGMLVTDTSGFVPAGTTVTSIVNSTSITLSAAPTGTNASDSLSFNLRAFGNITPVPNGTTDPATTAMLTTLQNYFNAIVAELNIHPGIAASAYSSIGGGFTSATTICSADVYFTIPSAITSAHFFQVYRSDIAQSTGPTSVYDLTPDDEMRLIYENNPTADQITARQVHFYDNVPESFRVGGAALYTNENTGEGILQANEAPPLSTDVALFKGYTFYSNTQTKHQKQISLLGTSNLLGSTLNIVRNGVTTTFTFGTTEDPSSATVAVSTASTPAQQVDATARSLERVINQQTALGINAFYLSGPNDVPGMLLLENATLEDIPFTITGDTPDGSPLTQFNPTLPTSGSAVISDNEKVPNRLYFSKYQQPEAVPSTNYQDVGPKDKAILRILPLRDSLFILSEAGVYRLAGTSPQTFTVSLFDSSTILRATDTAVVLNNQIYMLSNQGVTTISDTGISVISRPIEDKLLPLISPAYQSFTGASFAVAYETDRAYMLWTLSSPSDTVATVCYRYNTFTTTWVPWNVSKTCAAVNKDLDLLFMGASDINYIETERKSFSRLDYADRDYTYTVPALSVTGTTLSLGSLFNIAAQDTLVQTQYLTLDQVNRVLVALDADAGTQSKGYVSLAATAGADIRSVLTTLAARLDADPGLATKTYSSSIASIGTSFANSQTAFNTLTSMLNADTGTRFKSYPSSSGTVDWEVKVTALQGQSVVMGYAAPLLAGPITLYKQISSYATWAPHHFGDASIMKQVSEGTVIFEDMGFGQAFVNYESDLQIGDEPIQFFGDGAGTWGSFPFGQTAFGGNATSRPLRTYIPAQKQRCRYLKTTFSHSSALEKYVVFGLSYAYTTISSRGYR